MELKAGNAEPLEPSALEAIASMKASLRRQQQDCEEEAGKARRERRAAEEAMEQHEAELAGLEEKARKYVGLIKSTGNPVSEI